jgi:hypothetical protein
LEGRRLLERRTNPNDRRARALHLTEQGRQLLGLAMTAALAMERELCAALNVVEREQLLDLLQRVGDQLGLSSAGHAAHVHSGFSDEAAAPTPCGPAAEEPTPL